MRGSRIVALDVCIYKVSPVDASIVNLLSPDLLSKIHFMSVLCDCEMFV